VASKPAYVGSFYGSRRAGRGPGVPVAVRAGATVERLSLTLTRGGVIGGSLRLPGGEPALNMPVIAIEVDRAGGATRWKYSGGRTATDDRGQYRIFGLPPGDYLVIAQPSGLVMGSPTGANDAPQTHAAEVSWAEEMARARLGATAAPPARPPRGPTVNYATVFYPGSPDAALAVAVRVETGEERLGVDFALSLVSTARVSGTITDSRGQPAGAAPVALVAPDDRSSLAGIAGARPVVSSAADGSFTIPAVAPGRYRLTARAGAGAAVEIGLWAAQDIVIDGRDITNVSLQLQQGLSLSGRLAFTSASTPAPAAQDLARARIAVTPASVDGAVDAVAAARSSVAASVGADGAFVVGGLIPGTYRIGLTMPGARTSATAADAVWSLASITLGGADVTDRAFDLRPGEPMSGLVATFTDRPTELTGTLSGDAGNPSPGFPIVVFSTDRGEWRRGSRCVAVARPATDGSYRLIGLPPGMYHLTAVVSLESSDLDDPSFLEQLVPASLKITLAAGSRVVQHLKLAK